MLSLLAMLWGLPALAASARCRNGGEWVAHACTMDAQCVPYKPRQTDRVACIGSECCTVPCSNNGSYIGRACFESIDCLPYTTEKVACLHGLCCTVSFSSG
ncbi:unnamed protein product [Gongylonema pulchrum]|nr:unnamed protein product [Gongylonema pulchrum]